MIFRVFFGVATCVSLAMAQSKRMSAVLNDAPKNLQKWSHLEAQIVQKTPKITPYKKNASQLYGPRRRLQGPNGAAARLNAAHPARQAQEGS